MPRNYSPARTVQASGAVVAFVTCMRCGAALLLDPGDRFDVTHLHDAWHARLEAQAPGSPNELGVRT